MMGNIFNKYFLDNFIDSYRKELLAEIDVYEILDTTNIFEMVQSLKIKYTIEPLVLKEPIPSPPVETYIERANEWDQNQRYKRFEINITVPFEGNSKLFSCYPSASAVVNISNIVNIYINSISAKIVLNALDSNVYQSEVEKIISKLSTNIPGINSGIAPWNNGLESYIKSLLEKRKGVVSEKFSFMEKIGLKVNPKSNDFMVPSPITKKIVPVPVSETTKNVKREIVPILQEEVYKDIKEVLYNVGKAVERKPSIYLKKHEEDLRDIFLLFLETRYDSTSGVGEAFNKKGKTDILLKFAKDGTNLFVAECKFWKGQKKLHEGIDQLLGYLTHRDSKTALILFVDQKEFTSVVGTVKDEIKNHSQFKRYIRDTYEHSINYEFVLPDDSQKIIQIEVMLFHFPAIK